MSGAILLNTLSLINAELWETPSEKVSLNNIESEKFELTLILFLSCRCWRQRLCGLRFEELSHPLVFSRRNSRF